MQELEARDVGLAGPSTAPSWLPEGFSKFLRTGIMLFFAGCSAAVAAGGVAILCYLIATHSLTPRQLWYSTPLPLDLAGRELVSYASMLPPTTPSRNIKNNNGGRNGAVPPAEINLDPNSRFLPPGQRMDIWLDLVLPGSIYANELAHVVAELETADGRESGRATQPVMLRGRASSLWNLMMAPLRWVGIINDAQKVSVQLFNDYTEQKDAPFAAFKLTLKPRTDSSGPSVISADLRVHLRVGLLRKTLYYLRPNSLLALALGAGAACAAVGGSMGAALCLALLAYTLIRGGGGDGSVSGGRGSRLAANNRADSDSASELLAGVSSVATTPRDIDLTSEDEGEEAEQPQQEPGVVGAASPPTTSPSTGAPSPRDERPWQKLIKQLPLQGRPAPGDDTPYVGSEADRTASGASGRTELAGAGLRMRK